MSVTLLTIEEVAERLRCSPRTVKRRGIAYVRDGNRRLYDPADVNAYLSEQRVCPSSAAQTHLSGTRKFKSVAPAWSDLLKQRTGVKRCASKSSYEKT